LLSMLIFPSIFNGILPYAIMCLMAHYSIFMMRYNMNFDILRHHKPKISDYKECREFSVLIPIAHYQGKQCILFQVRSGALMKQPNEICFPGGKIEPSGGTRGIHGTAGLFNGLQALMQLFGCTNEAKG
ncbi:MAG: coenzyme pyrophosphatase, partial [Clostridia bacterium]|nr:coenzyme pyrophosphatase [Clostridia bacterium]